MIHVAKTFVVLNCREKPGFICSCHGCGSSFLMCKIWLYKAPMVIGHWNDSYQSLVPALKNQWWIAMFNVWQLKLSKLQGNLF